MTTHHLMSQISFLTSNCILFRPLLLRLSLFRLSLLPPLFVPPLFLTSALARTTTWARSSSPSPSASRTQSSHGANLTQLLMPVSIFLHLNPSSFESRLVVLVLALPPLTFNARLDPCHLNHAQPFCPWVFLLSPSGILLSPKTPKSSPETFRSNSASPAPERRPSTLLAEGSPPPSQPV